MTFILPAHSYADCNLKGISKLNFSFIGMHFGRDLSLEFSVTTPQGKVITKEIISDQVLNNIKSNIKIKHIHLGKYILTIKNQSNTPVSLMGGLMAIKHRLNGKQHIQQSSAFHIDLDPSEEIKYVYDACTGFIEDPQEELLRWNPFDWL